MINVRRFNLTSSKPAEHSELTLDAHCNTESPQELALADREATQSLHGDGRDLLAAVRSVAAANFESDERSSSARDIGQEAQRAGIVLEGEARLCVAPLKLPPSLRDRCDTARGPELRRLRRGFGCAEPEGDERKERYDGEGRCLRTDFHDAISPLWIDFACFYT
jgi:hypothetical protein